MPKFGASQGRLVHSENGELQCFPNKDWKLEFEISKEIGLNYIELLVERQPNRHNPFWSPEGRAMIVQTAISNNNEIYSCCFDYVIDNDIRNENDRHKTELVNFFEGCNDLSIPIIVLPLLEKSDLTIKNYKSFIPMIQKISDNLLPQSNILCIESLLPAKELSDFLKLVDRENVSCVYDTGNRVAQGADLQSEILLLNDWIKHFHIKDKNAYGENVILGRGLVDFKSVFDALRDIKYSGCFNFETTRGKDPKKTMKYHFYLTNFFMEESHI